MERNMSGHAVLQVKNLKTSCVCIWLNLRSPDEEHSHLTRTKKRNWCLVFSCSSSSHACWLCYCLPLSFSFPFSFSFFAHLLTTNPRCLHCWTNQSQKRTEALALHWHVQPQCARFLGMLVTCGGLLKPPFPFEVWSWNWTLRCPGAETRKIGGDSKRWRTAS